MSRIETITGIIDTAIKAGLNIGKVKAHGLCYLIQKDEQTFAARYLGNGDWESVTFDDRDSFAMYHRIRSEDESEDSTQGFGNNVMVTQTYNMRIVCYANANRIKNDQVIQAHSLKDDVSALMPHNLTSAELTGIDAQSARITQSTKEVDPKKVWEEETSGVEFKISGSQILLFIDYNIILNFQQSCREQTLCT